MVEFEILQYLMNQGVAIAMLGYFIIRFEKILKTNTKALSQMCELIKRGFKKNDR